MYENKTHQEIMDFVAEIVANHEKQYPPHDSGNTYAARCGALEAVVFGLVMERDKLRRRLAGTREEMAWRETATAECGV